MMDLENRFEKSKSLSAQEPAYALYLPKLKRSVTIQSPRLKSALQQLLAQEEDRYENTEALEKLIERVYFDPELQKHLFALLEAKSDALAERRDLEIAIQFYEQNPGWWKENIEDRSNHLLETLRGKVPAGFQRVSFDVQVGIGKGAYSFAKELILFVPQLIKLGYRLVTDEQTQSDALGFGKKLTEFYLALNFGNTQEKQRALEEGYRILSNLSISLWQQVKGRWEKAQKEGKEAEFLAEVTTVGLLQLLTLELSIAKSARAEASLSELAGMIQDTKPLVETGNLYRRVKAAKIFRNRIFRPRVPSMKLAHEIFPHQSGWFKKEFAKVPGRVTGVFDFRTAGGPLTRKLQETFSGGRYVEVVLDKEMYIHRAWAPDTWAKEFGTWWGVSRPRGSLHAKIDSALLPEWGTLTDKDWFTSQATKVTSAKLPKGTRIYIGEVSNQRGVFSGGRSQILVKGGVKPGWKLGKTRDLK